MVSFTAGVPRGVSDLLLMMLLEITMCMWRWARPSGRQGAGSLHVSAKEWSKPAPETRHTRQAQWGRFVFSPIERPFVVTTIKKHMSALSPTVLAAHLSPTPSLQRKSDWCVRPTPAAVAEAAAAPVQTRAVLSASREVPLARPNPRARRGAPPPATRRRVTRTPQTHREALPSWRHTRGEPCQGRLAGRGRWPPLETLHPGAGSAPSRHKGDARRRQT